MGTSSPRPSRKPTRDLKKWPDDRALHVAHATLLADMGKNDQAAAEVKKLMDGKNDRETYLSLAELYDKGSKFDDAAKALDAAEKLSPNARRKRTRLVHARRDV